MGALLRLALGYCVVICVHFELDTDTSMMTPLVVFTWKELREIKVRLGEGGKHTVMGIKKKN